MMQFKFKADRAYKAYESMYFLYEGKTPIGLTSSYAVVRAMAARSIAAGEVVSFDTGRNTADLISQFLSDKDFIPLFHLTPLGIIPADTVDDGPPSIHDHTHYVKRAD